MSDACWLRCSAFKLVGFCIYNRFKAFVCPSLPKKKTPVEVMQQRLSIFFPRHPAGWPYLTAAFTDSSESCLNRKISNLHLKQTFFCSDLRAAVETDLRAVFSPDYVLIFSLSTASPKCKRSKSSVQFMTLILKPPLKDRNGIYRDKLDLSCGIHAPPCGLLLTNCSSFPSFGCFNPYICQLWLLKNIKFFTSSKELDVLSKINHFYSERHQFIIFLFLDVVLSIHFC